MTGQLRERDGADWSMAGMQDSVSTRVYAVLALLGALIGWCVAAECVMKVGGYSYGFWPAAWRYADTGGPMIRSADGFYYIAQANAALANDYDGIPMFSCLTALLSRLLPLSVESVAFYMSLGVHLLLGLIVAAWGRMLNMGRLGVFLSSLIVPFMPVWMERGGPGHYDTDLIINLLLQLSLLLMVKAQIGLRERNAAWLWFAAAMASFGLLYCFWPSGKGLALPAVAMWVVLFLPLRILGLKKRFIVLALAAVWAIWVLLLPEWAPAPRSTVAFIHSTVASALGVHTSFITTALNASGLKSDIFFNSVQEMQGIAVKQLFIGLGGSLSGGLVLAASAFLALVRSPGLRFPLLFGAIWLVLGLHSQRLIYLGSFPLCLALGSLPRVAGGAFGWLPHMRPWLTKLSGLALVAVVIASCIHWRLHNGVDVRWQNEHDRLLAPLKADMGDQPAFLWNWWDDGYFLMARLGTKATVHFHGGGGPLKGYIPGHSFVMEDRELAARWIRFFAVRGEEGLAPAFKAWGEDAAWDNIERILAGEKVEGLDRIEGGGEWFFPKGKVYWYMPSYFFTLSNWWVPLGLSRDPDSSLVRSHIETITVDQFHYEPSTGALTVEQKLWDRGYKDFGMVIHTPEMPLTAPWPTANAPYIVYSGQTSYAYIVDQLGVRTLPLYMMAPGGPAPTKFRQVALDPTWGGIWEVLP